MYREVLPLIIILLNQWIQHQFFNGIISTLLPEVRTGDHKIQKSSLDHNGRIPAYTTAPIPDTIGSKISPEGALIQVQSQCGWAFLFLDQSGPSLSVCQEVGSPLEN